MKSQNNVGLTKPRVKPQLSEPRSYFVSDKPNHQFVHSGCTVLDCALGGGWCLGRVANIIGDKSTAKTHLSWEALTNFLRQYPNGKAAYRETEAAFDAEYARAMGFPVDKVERLKDRLPTVEAFEKDIKKFIGNLGSSPGMYVLDSLDALSDEAELKLEPGKGSYGAAKAKGLSALFRKITNKVETSQCSLMIISQIRDKIGVMFGEKTTRSGGHALDFYATHIVKLAHIKTIGKTIKGITRPIGITIKAKITKNKVSPPFRVVEFDFLNVYGIDDITASRDWLKEVKRPDDVPDSTINEVVKRTWADIETSFLPKKAKYA